MKKTWLVGISAMMLVTACAARARAEDVSAKKLVIKDNVDKPEKRQVQVQSVDAGVQYSEADDPGMNGASLHVYSATDDMCIVLPADGNWIDKGTKWKYKNKLTKRSAQIGDKKLLVKIKSGVSFTLADDGTQGTVNAQVQFGSGTRYCMKCTADPKKDTVKKFIGKDCAVAACDAEPSVCDPTVTTTTTTSTTMMVQPGLVLQGALPKTTGKFNYNLTPGIAGSDAACNTNFPGTHTCTFPELQSAEAAGDLVGLKDINNTTVTSFWVVDPTHAVNVQCNDTLGTGLNWDYLTAHTGVGGEASSLNNGAGTLGPVSGGLICGGMRWVGCCM